MAFVQTRRLHHLIDTKDLSREEIDHLLERARYWEKKGEAEDGPFRGRFAANLFFEPSTRTRFSFEVAERRLGMEVLRFEEGTSSTVKGESLLDTLRTLEALGVDVAVIRRGGPDILGELALRVRSIRLVNAGEGCTAHPTQALLDLYTLQKHFGEVKGITVAMIGDLRHSRVVRSNLWSLKTFGARVILSGPESMRAPELEAYAPYVPLEEAIRQADAVMMLRVQLERHREALFSSAEEYHRAYGLTMERFARMSPHAVIMHPGPVNRGVEIADELVEHPRSKIFEQMACGVPVRMAVLEWAMKGGEKG
ncbi:MAG: aspartate carbamoyltransferase catalytic subunit [Planifilum fimeticola]